MIRRAAFVLVVLSLLGVPMTRSIWSGGTVWGPSATGTVGKWLPDGAATPSGDPVPDVAVAGHLVLNKIQNAQWSLGPSDYLAELAPGSASLTFTGQLTAAPDDDVVISTGWGTMWAGRVDSVTETRDVSGHYQTTISATDRVGALGSARLRKVNGYKGTLDTIAVALAADAGITLRVTDASVGTYGLATLQKASFFGVTFTGSVLEYINAAARSSNAMLALQPDGSLAAMTREAPTSPPTPVTLTGANAPSIWTKTTAWGNDINRMTWTLADGTDLPDSTWPDDIRAHGERVFSVDYLLDIDVGVGERLAFLDWWAYNNAIVARPTVTNGEFVVSDLSQGALLTLAPLDWVTVDGHDWQVMSMAWSVDSPGQPMRLTVTADDFLNLL